MIRILITGVASYIGTSFEKYIFQWPSDYQIETIDMIDGSWENKNFSSYDIVFHVAGIVHIKETKENTDLYYQVNRDLVFKTARKAKNEGVKQFIFLSSMSIYGMESGHITKDTKPNPKNNYGKSKIQAEELIKPLADKTFTVSIIRPPMVYGKGCKGNYQILSKYAKKLPLFPNIKNQRSMIYIDNLSYFIKYLIDSRLGGVYLPQNSEYICTSSLVNFIADKSGHKIVMTVMFNWCIKLAIFLRFVFVEKVFGNLTYEKINCINIVDFDESIQKIEAL